MTTAPDKQHQWPAALGRVPSGLFILTARHEGTESGMLASWVQQCSFTPPAVSVALKAERPMAGWLVTGAEFVLNILDQSQTDMIAHFGKGFAPGQDAFAKLDVERDGVRAPVLVECLAYLECRVLSRFAPGDHDLVIAEVIGGRVLADSQPMVHVRKNGLHY